jgi:chitin synthase
MLTNAALAVAIENINGFSNDLVAEQTALQNKQHTYFVFILWATFGLSMVRFTGVSFFSFSS